MTTTGGPAFPTDSEHQSGPSTWHHSGMTLRDWFATHATEDDIAEYMPATMGEARLHPNRTRQWARYQHADAMLAAREISQCTDATVSSQAGKLML